MGKLNTLNQPPDQTIIHFSHIHPLNLTNSSNPSSSSSSSSICSCCQLPISNQIYSCHSCKFFLHIKCSQKPHQIKHPFHQNHIFTLLPLPIYPEGSFNCDACGKNGDGFSYHCGICNIDLHVLCASMPLSLTNSFHPHHQLNLSFSTPYENKAFSCDVCRKPGSKTWLYRCGICEFDCHLDCSNYKSMIPVLNQQMRIVNPPMFRPNYNPNPMMMMMIQRMAPVPVVVHHHRRPNLMQNYGYGVVNSRQNGMMGNNGIVSNLFHGIVDGASQTAAGQQLLQNLVGGGGGSGGDGGGGIDGGDFVANLFS